MNNLYNALIEEFIAVNTIEEVSDDIINNYNGTVRNHTGRIITYDTIRLYATISIEEFEELGYIDNDMYSNFNYLIEEWYYENGK